MLLNSRLWIYTVIIVLIILFSSPAAFAQNDNEKAAQYSQSAYQYLEKKEWYKALQTYEEALKYTPHAPDIHNNMGYIYFEQKKYPEARKAIKEALKHKNDFPDAWTNLGNIEFSEGHLEKALQAYQQSLEYSPNDTGIKKMIDHVRGQIHKQKTPDIEFNKHDIQPTNKDEQQEKHEEEPHHGVEFLITLLISFTLIAGAATRLIAKKINFPYTIAMLLLGFGLGLLVETFQGTQGFLGLIKLPKEGAIISPQLIIFVFLPALIFESAFSLDAHLFKKLLGIVTFLAAPTLLVATVATGALLFFTTGLYTGWEWTFMGCLVFGGLISATDPVAVVAILRELGVPKRLAILIEGESLLNDGTAIVVFNVFLALFLAGTGVDALFNLSSLGTIGYDFMRVVLGGIAVGFILAWLFSHWISRTFNDPLVEITLTLVLAYSCMLIAEGLFHVSGVMALVVAGLYMSSVGKTRISPEVFHFLHQFWGMLAYLANTLIFFLVGVVISIQFATTHTPLLMTTLIIALIVYIGLMLIRFVTNFASKVILDWMGMSMTIAETTISSWGGLRGAVSLALGLIISQDTTVAVAAAKAGLPDFPNQLFLITVCVVLSTILVNGTTTKIFLNLFGYNKTPLSEKIADLSALRGVLEQVHQTINILANSQDLKTVAWGEIEEVLEQRQETLQTELELTKEQMQSANTLERASGYWSQILNFERETYWSAFSEGTLSANAVLALTREIDLQQDQIAAGDLSPPETRSKQAKPISSLLNTFIRKNLFLKRFFTEFVQFEDLSLLYDLSYGESYAARKVLENLEKFTDIEEEVAEAITVTYQRYARLGKERLEDMRQNLPELTQSIETRLANRIALNIERKAYEELEHHGAISERASQLAREEVEEKIKRIQLSAKHTQLPSTSELLSELTLFKDLTDEQQMQLANLAVEMVLPKGDYLFYENDSGDSLFVIVRGAAHITKNLEGQEEIVDIIGGGDIVGEVALLNGEPRTASVKAATTLTLLKITRDAFNQLLGVYPELGEKVWHAFMCNKFDSYLRWLPQFQTISQEQRKNWLQQSGKLLKVQAGTTLNAPREAHYVFLVAGQLSSEGEVYSAPSLFDVQYNSKIEALKEVRMTWLAQPPSTTHIRDESFNF